MILYHGTSKKNGEAILRDGIIRCHCDRLYTHTTAQTSVGILNLATSDGFVYLTPWLPLAVKYGYSASILCNHKQVKEECAFFVFQIEIPDNLLLADLDQLRIVKIESIASNDYKASIAACNSVRVNQDLPLQSYSGKYLIAPTLFADVPEIDAVLDCRDSWEEYLINEENKYIYDIYIEKFCTTFPFEPC